MQSDYFPRQNSGASWTNRFTSWLVPDADNRVTSLLIYFHLLVFTAMVVSGVDAISPSGQNLLRWGANFKASTMNGESWRLLTSVFTHSSLLSLLVNMLALYCIGSVLEPLLGRISFLLVYIIAGICGSVLSLWWHDLSITAGAAGSVFGLYGVFVALLMPGRALPKESPILLLFSTAIFIVYNLAYDVKDGIDNASHIGGLMSGFVMGLMLLPSLSAPGYTAILRANLLIILMVFSVGIYAFYQYAPDSVARYEEVMKQFAANEAIAMKAYRNPEGLNNHQWRKQLSQVGIEHWNRNLTLLDGLDRLPEPLASHVNQLRHYCVLRRSVFRMRANSIGQNTDQYEEQIRNTNLEIEGILMDLRKVRGKEL
jgi:rhomboid protease GluP